LTLRGAEWSISTAVLQIGRCIRHLSGSLLRSGRSLCDSAG
jgi:hypothetical protein